MSICQCNKSSFAVIKYSWLAFSSKHVGTISITFLLPSYSKQRRSHQGQYQCESESITSLFCFELNGVLGLNQ